MKKYLLPGLLVGVLAFTSIAPSAFASAYDWHLSTRNSSDTADTVVDMTPPANGFQNFLVNDSTTFLPTWAHFGTHFDVDAGGQVSINSIGEDRVDNLTGDLVSLGSRIDDLNTNKVDWGNFTTVSGYVTSITAQVNALQNRLIGNLFGTSTDLVAGQGTTTKGFMLNADKTKLDALASSSAWSWSSPSRSIVTGTGATGFQPSSTRNSTIRENVKVTTTASIAGNADGYVALEIAPTNSATAGDWVEMGRCGNSQALTLAITLQSVQGTTCQLTGDVPAGYYAKLRSVTTTGTVTYAFVSAQEVLK